jgi:hypothetical protein
MELSYLPLTADELPVSKIFELNGELYNFVFRKNEKYDKIYCEIRDLEDNVIYTTRLVYGGEVVHAVIDGFEIDPLVPLNFNDLFTDKILETVFNSTNMDRVKIHVIA